MTFTLHTPARHIGTPGLRPLFGWLKGLINRIGLAAWLERLSNRQMRDAGLHGSDIDWLRTHGTPQDAATGLAIRAGQRAGNW